MSQASSQPFTITVRPAPQTALPAWVPPAGYFADVPMLNFPQDVSPSIYPVDNYLMNNPFVIWGGSAILRDYSALGAQVYYSGGHESAAAQHPVLADLRLFQPDVEKRQCADGVQSCLHVCRRLRPGWYAILPA
jgi:hypothetical protein